jgi:uncharacterized membrane protein
MKTNKKIALVALASTLLLGLTGCFNHSPEDKADWATSKIARKLDLTETQKTKLDELKDVVLETRKKMYENRDTDIETITAMATSDALDTVEIKNMLTSKTTNMEQYADPVINKLAEFHATLNAEQKLQVAGFIKDHQGDHGKRGHGHW